MFVNICICLYPFDIYKFQIWFYIKCQVGMVVFAVLKKRSLGSMDAMYTTALLSSNTFFNASTLKYLQSKSLFNLLRFRVLHFDPFFSDQVNPPDTNALFLVTFALRVFSNILPLSNATSFFTINSSSWKSWDTNLELDFESVYQV